MPPLPKNASSKSLDGGKGPHRRGFHAIYYLVLTTSKRAVAFTPFHFAVTRRPLISQTGPTFIFTWIQSLTATTSGSLRITH